VAKSRAAQEMLWRAGIAPLPLLSEEDQSADFRGDISGIIDSITHLERLLHGLKADGLGSTVSMKLFAVEELLETIERQVKEVRKAHGG
jgi:hypothetical protein